MKFEYQIVSLPMLAGEPWLNDIARQGWRLVAVAEQNRRYFYHFEREGNRGLTLPGDGESGETGGK